MLAKLPLLFASLILRQRREPNHNHRNIIRSSAAIHPPQKPVLIPSIHVYPFITILTAVFPRSVEYFTAHANSSCV